MSNFLPPAVFQIEADASKFHAVIGGIEGELKKLQGITDKSAKGFSGMEKSAQKATGAIRALTVAKALFVAYGLKEVLQLQQAYNNLGGALANVGLATDANRGKAEGLVESLGKLGFAGDQAANGLATLITATGNLEKSQRLLGIAANYARAQQVGLEDASRAILSAQNGNIKVFRQFGIELDTTVSRTKAVEKAMGELETRLKDRAKNATNDLGVQIAILKNQFMSFVESLASYVMPWITKFVSGIIAATEWVKQHKAALMVVAGVLTTIVLVGIVKVTQALWAQAAAWAAANWQITAIVAVVVAAAAAFVYLWNKFKGFREAVIVYVKSLITQWTTLAKVILLFAETAVMAFSLAMNGFLLFVRATANAQIALGKLFGNKEMQKTGKETLDWIDSANKNVTDFGNKIVGLRKKIDEFSKGAKDKLDGLKDIKIDTSKFKLPKFEIPKFTNGKPVEEGIDSAVAEGLARAQRRIKDFNEKLAESFEGLTKSWKDIVGRDFAGEIARGVDEVDKIIREAQTAINSYAAASSRYAAASNTLAQRQAEYAAAVKSGNQTIIDGAESALAKAEAAAQGIYDAMGGALKDIYSLQTQMIEKAASMNEEIKRLEDDRTKTLESARKQRLELEQNYNENVAKMRKDYNKAVSDAENDAVKRRAEIVQQSIDLLRNAFKQATYKSVGDIFSALTFEGRYMKGGTTERLLKALGLQTSKAKTLAADAATLAGMGFSQTFIQEIISQGPDVGHQMAQTIIRSTPDQVMALQALWSELQATSSHGVDGVAKTLNVGVKLATEELTAQLKQVDTDLAASLANMAKTLQENLTDAFVEYSKALDGINIRTAEQITAIDAQITALQAKIAQLQAALAALAGLGAPGTSSPGITLPSGGGPLSGASDAELRRIKAVQETQRLKDETARIRKQIEDRKKAADDAKKDTSPNLGSRPLGFTPDTKKDVSPNLGSRPFGGNGDDRVTAKKGTGAVTINVTAKTNASAQQIANEVGWAIRTSGDVQYRTPVGGGRYDAMAD